jgi:rhamnosyl/mannosyltransferase
MRVLHVYKDVHPPVVGGVEKHIDGLRRALSPDVRCDVLVSGRSRRTTTAQVNGAIEIRAAELGPRPLSLALAPSLPLLARRAEVDLVHVHMPNPPGELSGLALPRGTPLVASYHADPMRQARLRGVYRPIISALLERADALVVGSRGILETSPWLGGQEGRARVIRYGIDLRRFDPAAVDPAERDRLRARWGRGRPLVVVVGRLVHYKGIEVLIEAAPRIDAEIVVAGSGPLEGRLRDLAAPVANVSLAGFVPEARLPTLLAAADVFVLPSTSRAESFGIAALEAQAMGIPAVVTDVGSGTTESISVGETGLVCPPRDPVALAEALTRALVSPGMGAGARERVAERFDLDRQAQEMRALYEEVIDRARTRSPGR